MMNGYKIYLAGPMEGLTAEQMQGWRKEMTAQLAWLQIYDPTRRIEYHSGDGINRARFLFQMDLKDIDESDIIFVDARAKAGRGTGTSMEVMYAWMKQKPIIVWADPEDFHHPFYQAMETYRVYSISEGVQIIKAFFEIDDEQQANT